MSDRMWMVRSEGGILFKKFKKDVVAVGWHELGDLTNLKTKAQIRKAYKQVWPDAPEGRVSNVVSILYRFRTVMKKGDYVITYGPQERVYLIGKIKSDFIHSKKLVGEEWPNVRKVDWLGEVSRDVLRAQTRNHLGSTLTLFSISDDAFEDLLTALKNPDSAREEVEIESGEADLKEDELAKSIEMIKDSIIALDDQDLERLVAALLRAMGYRTWISPKGPDRNIDVIASPDGLGLVDPRIKVEVKHRPTSSIGAPDIRSFLSALRHEGDRGLYVSTGGFTKEAKYEADRSKMPIKLLDLDELALRILDRYEDFDSEGHELLPLVRIYVPAK